MSRNFAGGIAILLLMAIAVPSAASDLVGSGGVGFRGGSLLFLQDADVKENASPRLAGDLVFTYVYTDHIDFDLTVGYGWNRLGDDERFWLASVVPMTLGARYVMMDGRKFRPYLGAGGGMYVWSIQSKDLGASKDLATFERLRRADLGFYGLAGVEHQTSKNIVMTGDFGYHYILAENTTDFPTAFNGNKGYAQVRIGVTFFFSLSERVDSGFPE